MSAAAPPGRSLDQAERGKLVRNLLSNYTLYGFQLLAGLILLPLLIRRLGVDAYGVFYVINEVFGHTSILYLGLGTACTRFVADHDARRESREISRLVATVFHLYLVIGGVLLVAALVAAPAFSHLPKLRELGEPLLSQVPLVVVLLGLVLAVNFPGSALGATLRGMRRYDLCNGISLAAAVGRFIAILVFVRGDRALVWLAAITLGTSVLEQLGRWILLRRLLPSLSLSPRLFTRKVLGRIKGLTAGSFLISVSEKIIFSTDALVIMIFLGPGWVATYAVANTLIEYGRRIVAQFSDILTPSIAVFNAQGHRDKVRHLLLVGTRFSLLLACPLAVGLMLLGPAFTTIWVDQTDVVIEKVHAVLYILAIPHLLRLASSTCGAVLWGINKVRFPSLICLAEALGNLGLSLLLVGTFDLGLEGVALGTAIPMVVASCFLVPAYTVRQVQLEGRRFIRGAILPPLLSTLPMIALLLVGPVFLPPTSREAIFILATASVAVYWSVCWFSCLDEDQRRTWRQRIPFGRKGE